MEGEKFYMIDAHVHLEKGDYSVKWIEQFIEYAVKRNIDEMYSPENVGLYMKEMNALIQSV